MNNINKIIGVIGMDFQLYQNNKQENTIAKLLSTSNFLVPNSTQQKILDHYLDLTIFSP